MCWERHHGLDDEGARGSESTKLKHEETDGCCPSHYREEPEEYSHSSNKGAVHYTIQIQQFKAKYKDDKASGIMVVYRECH